MSFETTKDVLNHARDFHGRVSDYYKGLSARNTQQRVKMLLDYLSRHEKHLEKSLKDFEDSVSNKVLNTWFQYPPPKHVLNTCVDLNLDIAPDLTVDGVIELALKLDDCLIDLYQSMVTHSESREVKEVFGNLLEMERKEEHRLVKDSLQMKEL